MKTKSFIISAFTAMAALSACSEDENIMGADSGNQLQVSASIPALTRAAIEGTQLPENAQLGISLFNPDGTDYDGKQQGYKNVLYKSELLTSGGVKWSSANPIILSPSKGKAVAYYPHSAAVADITAIPVETASQTDYLYSDWVNDLSFKNPQANFTMNHALCAVQINLVNESYTAGQGQVTQLSVASPALATTASLNAQTGQLSAFAGQGDVIAVDKTFTLTGESQGTKVIAIPTRTQGNLTIKVVVDGATSTVPVTLNQPLVQGKAYVVNLKVKDAKTPVELVSVTVKEWTEEQIGDLEAYPIKPDNKFIYKVAIPTNDTEFSATFRGFSGTIDWGDETEPTSHSNENNPSHTYANAGSYTISMSIDNNSWLGQNGFGVYAKYITDITYIGSDIGYQITNMNSAFSDTQITSIQKGLFDNCPNITNFVATFSNCKKLASIPDGLFDNCPNVISFASTFIGCSALETIPENLFYNQKKANSFTSTFSRCTALKTVPNIFSGCTNTTSFEYTFKGCTSLTNIATGLFDNCKDVSSHTGFRSTFEGCTALTEIPSGLFNNFKKVTDFMDTFSGCTGLKEIPRIFDGCTGVTRFSNTFKECRGLTQIAQGLFDGCPNVTEFYFTFNLCTSLTIIPQLFDKCTEVIGFKNTFYQCGSLKTIPAGLFDNCRKVTDFNYTFHGCMVLTGESPYTMINGEKIHLYERGNHPEHFVIPQRNNYCFSNCWDLTDYANIPRGWR